ncbi:DUF4044 domain-containing protein [Clostridium sp.]
MKAKTRKKLTKVLVIFMILVFVLSLLPVVLG